MGNVKYSKPTADEMSLDKKFYFIYFFLFDL